VLEKETGGWLDHFVVQFREGNCFAPGRLAHLSAEVKT
jgi:hypothetical protein